jgi:hypothetical protein
MIKTLKVVKSSMIYAVGYCPKEKLLEVVFTKGKLWAYEDVPKDVYEGLLNAESPGSYMRNYILDCYNDYPLF